MNPRPFHGGPAARPIYWINRSGSIYNWGMAQHPLAAAFASVAHAIARLTDSAPPAPLVCAWCVTFDPALASNRGASHVMCAPCAARFADDDDAKGGGR